MYDLNTLIHLYNNTHRTYFSALPVVLLLLTEVHFADKIFMNTLQCSIADFT